MFSKHNNLKLIKWLPFAAYTEGVVFFTKFNLANTCIKKMTTSINV